MGIRNIIFRGKTKQGDWVYGAYYKQDHYYNEKVEKHCIITSSDTLGNDMDLDFYDVIPESVGQFTGLTDKNGKKIFEGDILRLCNATYPILVYWDCLGWKFLRNGKRVQGAFECDIKHDIEICEIIGNIYDNPELLGE